MNISVIITTYNQCKEFINECIDSVHAQTLRPEFFETILIDDNSTRAETIRTIEHIQNNYKNIKVVRSKDNIGPNLTRKEALKYAHGKYIFYIDADDMLTRDALETLWIATNKENHDVICGLLYRYNAISKSYEKLNKLSLIPYKNRTQRLQLNLSLELGGLSMCNSLIKKSLLTPDVFELKDDRVFHEDMTNWTRILFKCKSIYYSEQFTYYYRWNPGSITTSFTIKHAEGVIHAINDWIRLVGKEKNKELLTPYLIQGISKALNFYVLRSLYKSDDKIKVIKFLAEEITNLPFVLFLSNHNALKLIYELSAQKEIDDLALSIISKKYINTENRIVYTPHSKLKYHIKPSELAKKLNGKIVLLCEIDYHVQSAILFCNKTNLNRNSYVILDNSDLADQGKRRSSIKQNKTDEYKIIKANELPYEVDSLATAKLVICFNDFNNHSRDALEFRFLHKKPTVCLVEGISDFKRVDFKKTSYNSYRRCEYVFLTGENDKHFFSDRNTYIVGMPIVEELYQKNIVYPKEFCAVLNVNFTYGCLEDKREAYIEEAVKAFKNTNCTWVISKHPMDNGFYNELPVSNLTQYELIDSCSVFISRFGTGIIEALASGKPVIYFNPHGEKVDKFKDPMDAYYIANDYIELAEAIDKVKTEITNKIDFRAKANDFLKKHAALKYNEQSCTERFEKAIESILAHQ